jgi:hypothetical protein
MEKRGAERYIEQRHYHSVSGYDCGSRQHVAVSSADNDVNGEQVMFHEGVADGNGKSGQEYSISEGRPGKKVKVKYGAEEKIHQRDHQADEKTDENQL